MGGYCFEVLLKLIYGAGDEGTSVDRLCNIGEIGKIGILLLPSHMEAMRIQG